MTTPFLSNVGIAPLIQARSPTPETFPSALNTNARSIWGTAVAETPSVNNPVEDWARCLKRYVELCEQQDVFPFQAINQSRNDQIADFLWEARQAVVHYIDKAKLFDELKIIRSERKVNVSHNGFSIQVSAKVNITDPSFEKWLIQIPYPHFNIVRQADGKYIKNLQTGVRMVVVNGEPQSRGGHMPRRWHIGYEIECPMFPEVPTSELPSKAELEKFVMDTMWMP
ncbi:MAG: hypothetical protein ABSA33_05070, partial [Candidatus Micrarchaeaceae archaeon]